MNLNVPNSWLASIMLPVVWALVSGQVKCAGAELPLGHEITSPERRRG